MSVPNSMKSTQLRAQHLKYFAKLPLSERLSWALGQGWFFAGFMDEKARRINRKLRRDGKKYFKASFKDIEKMKKASGRPVDIADIELIMKAQAKNI